LTIIRARSVAIVIAVRRNITKPGVSSNAFPTWLARIWEQAIKYFLDYQTIKDSMKGKKDQYGWPPYLN